MCSTAEATTYGQAAAGSGAPTAISTPPPAMVAVLIRPKPTSRSDTPCASEFHAACRRAAPSTAITTAGVTDEPGPDGTAATGTAATGTAARTSTDGTDKMRLLKAGPPFGGRDKQEPSGLLSRQVWTVSDRPGAARSSPDHPDCRSTNSAGSRRNPRRNHVLNSTLTPRAPAGAVGSRPAP